MSVEVLASLGEREVAELSDVLIDCVEGGASVSFMHPLSREKAERFWRSSGDSVDRGERIVIGAKDADGVIVGTLSVIFAVPENQPHRADLAKMLVHRRARNAGVGAALLQAAEQAARAAGRWLLVLDTVTDSAAARLYVRHGWRRCGEIPNYALWPDGRLCPTTFYYKELQRTP